MTTLNLTITSDPDNGIAADNGTYGVGGGSGLLGFVFGAVRFSHWYRFTGVSGLSGVTIDTAILGLATSIGAGAGTNVKVFAEPVAAPVIPVSVADYVAKARTSAAVSWALAASLLVHSVAIPAVIQELADSIDPAAIQILHDEDAATGFSSVRFFLAGPFFSPTLDIDFSAPVTSVPGIAVAASDDSIISMAASADNTIAIPASDDSKIAVAGSET